MKVLIINHCFDQDIDALLSAPSKEDFEFKIISPLYFSLRAARYFPEAVFQGLLEFHNPVYKNTRRKWEKKCKEALYELYRLFSFDVIVSPSDTFFYIRDTVKAARDLGIPFIVAQKETTISPFSMNEHSLSIGKLYPFISDYMSVCSKRHKDFWIAAGTPENKIEVTGQPRFDFYLQPKKWKSLDDLGASQEPNLKKLLFFSYELDAYLPLNGGTGVSWLKLREETEEVLMKLVKAGEYSLMVKPHPQQKTDDLKNLEKRLKRLSEDKWLKKVFLLERSFDTRQLIVNSDIIIGFQTTALFEAMITGKEVIYTHWTPEAEKFEKELIPFYKYIDIIKVVKSPAELEKYVLIYKKEDTTPEIMKNRLELFNEYLGPLDGKGAERTLRIIKKVCNDYPPLTEEQLYLQETLKKNKTYYLRKEILLARLKLFMWQAMAHLFYSFHRCNGFDLFRNGINRTIKWQKERILECETALGLRDWIKNEITGKIWNPPLVNLIRKFIARRIK